MSNHPNLLKIIITSKQKKKKRTEQSIHDLIKSKEKKKGRGNWNYNIYIYLVILSFNNHTFPLRAFLSRILKFLAFNTSKIYYIYYTIPL